jgi:hypothetical protein
MEEGDKNYIPCLKNERGEMEWAHDQKEATVHNYFQNLLGKKLQRREGINWDMLHMPRLPDHSTDHPLDAPFSELETSAAIAELPTKKAPDPDGFTGLFYKTCWKTIKAEVIAAFQCLYNQTTGPMPKLNGASITLFQKRKWLI